MGSPRPSPCSVWPVARCAIMANGDAQRDSADAASHGVFPLVGQYLVPDPQDTWPAKLEPLGAVPGRRPAVPLGRGEDGHRPGAPCCAT